MVAKDIPRTQDKDKQTQASTLQTTANAIPRTQVKEKQVTQDTDKADESKTPKQMLMIMTSDPRHSEEESAPLKVTYYDWHRIHKAWLNNVMKEKLGVKEGLG